MPALLVKLGRYPYHHGGLGVVRSLGRCGVPVHAIVEDRLTPVACSRYLSTPLVWPTTGAEDPSVLVGRLLAIGARIRRSPATGRIVAVPTDDEAAVVLAEHAATLGEHFAIAPVRSALPRQLASKRGLDELCRQHEVPTARAAFPASLDEAIDSARQLGYPVVAKNVAAFTRLVAPVVAGTTIVANEADLVRRLAGLSDYSGLSLQEYIPYECSQDWFVALYRGAHPAASVHFAGRKVLSWPPGRGVTARAVAAPNTELLRLTQRFTDDVDWRGIASLDWRLDLRDNTFKLLDFNVRVGAQFRLGSSVDGTDVVRALHRDLSGRSSRTQPAAQDYSRRFVVGNLSFPARLAGEPAAASKSACVGVLEVDQRLERAWLATDDPVPAIIMATRGLRALAGATVAALRQRRRSLPGGRIDLSG